VKQRSKDDEQLVALADRHVGKAIWECDEKPCRSHKAIEITTWGPLSKPPQIINGTCVEAECSGKPFPNEFEVPSRCILGAGKGAVCGPELLFDLVLAELKKDPENKTFLPYFDECIEAHRQREDALGIVRGSGSYQYQARYCKVHQRACKGRSRRSLG
jgi:hypothetical protein